jgi:hypothetical protein
MFRPKSMEVGETKYADRVCTLLTVITLYQSIRTSITNGEPSNTKANPMLAVKFTQDAAAMLLLDWTSHSSTPPCRSSPTKHTLIIS